MQIYVVISIELGPVLKRFNEMSFFKYGWKSLSAGNNRNCLMFGGFTNQFSENLMHKIIIFTVFMWFKYVVAFPEKGT
jgi:hypothetical protein